MAYLNSTEARLAYRKALADNDGDLPPFEEWYANQTTSKDESEMKETDMPETKEVEKKVKFKIPSLNDVLVGVVKKVMKK